MKKIETVAFILAMVGEAVPIIERLGLKEIERNSGADLGLRAFSGNIQSLKVYVCLNGLDVKYQVDNIGTEISALNAYSTIHEFAPDLLVNAGTAGGFAKHGAQIGNIYFSDQCIVRHDHRIALPGFQEYGIGRFSVAALAKIPELLGGKRSIITTGNSLDLAECDAHMIAQSGAAVKDMEAAAIARIAELKQVPFMAVKAITDFADSPNNHDAFIENYALATDALADTLEKFVLFLADGKNISDL